MDGSWFDAVTTMIGKGQSRRIVIQGLLVESLLALGVRPAAAADVGAAGCRGTGNSCKGDKQCCSNRCKQGRCQCKPSGAHCQKSKECCTWCSHFFRHDKCY